MVTRVAPIRGIVWRPPPSDETNVRPSTSLVVFDHARLQPGELEEVAPVERQALDLRTAHDPADLMLAATNQRARSPPRSPARTSRRAPALTSTVVVVPASTPTSRSSGLNAAACTVNPIEAGRQSGRDVDTFGRRVDRARVAGVSIDDEDADVRQESAGAIAHHTGDGARRCLTLDRSGHEPSRTSSSADVLRVRDCGT